jgi:DNA-binding MarR family transcriptional regulator
MLMPLTRALIEAERPILAANGITMWAYAVLSGLRSRPTRSQAAVADAIGGDKTRLIPVFDDLQARGLISRERDPDDRRAYLLALTTAGAALHDKVQREIQRSELRLLGRLSKPEQERFIEMLQVLATAPGQPVDD